MSAGIYKSRRSQTAATRKQSDPVPRNLLGDFAGQLGDGRLRQTCEVEPSHGLAGNSAAAFHRVDAAPDRAESYAVAEIRHRLAEGECEVSKEMQFLAQAFARLQGGGPESGGGISAVHEDALIE